MVGCLCLTAGAGAAQAQTVTFLSTGAEQTFTVPEGVTSIQMVAIGGRGGDGTPSGSTPGGSGGFGAIVGADIAVTPGQILFVEVAGNGASAASGGAGGFNGGGAGEPRLTPVAAAGVPPTFAWGRARPGRRSARG